MSSENVQNSEDLFDSESQQQQQQNNETAKKNIDESCDLFSGKTNKDTEPVLAMEQDTPDLFFSSEDVGAAFQDSKEASDFDLDLEQALPENEDDSNSDEDEVQVEVEEDIIDHEELEEPVEEENYATDEEFEEEMDKENEPDTELNIPTVDLDKPGTSKETADSETVKKPKPVIVLKDINLPLSKVKNIMKLDPDVNIVSQEAVLLVTKATEMFIQALARESCKVKPPKKKTIQKSDFDQALTLVEALEFLEGAMDWS